MAGVNIGISGSIHQGNERFSDKSRGRQCSFMISPRCCSMSTLPSEVNRLSYNLSNEANKTSELPSEVNKLNSNLPNETNETKKRDIKIYT